MTRLTNFVLWLVSALVALQSFATAATIDVDTVLGPNHPYPDQTITVIDGANPPTHLTILEGAGIGNFSGGPPVPVGLDLYGSSRAHMLGGAISGFPHNVLLHDTSVFRMDAGSLDLRKIEARDDSTVILNGGAWREVEGHDSSRIRVKSGDDSGISPVSTFGQSHAAISPIGFLPLDFYANESSTMVINGGSFEGAEAMGNAEVLINGGSYVTGLRVSENAIVRMRRIVTMNEEYVVVSDNAVVHVYGTNLRFDMDDENHKLVLGNWPDGDDFGLRYRLFNQGQIILHEVPEPASCALLAVGALRALLARRRMRGRTCASNA